MRKNNTFAEIWKRLEASDKILIPLHEHPDGDSFGSSLAMYHILKDLGKSVVVTSADEVCGFFDLLNESKIVVWGKDPEEVDYSEFDTVLALDCASANRCSGNKSFKFPKDITVINIDHHKTNQFFGDFNYVEMSIATSLIIYEMFNKLGIKADSRVLKMLLLGMLTDSGIFSFKGSDKLFGVAQEIVNKGIDYYDLVRTIRFNTPLEDKIFLKLALNNAVYNREGKFVYTKISYSNLKENGIAGVPLFFSPSEFLDDIKGFDFSFSLVEKEPGAVRISFRSQKGVDVSIFAAGLGGGGHPPSAGAVLENTNIAEAEKKVLGVIKNQL